MCLLTLYSICMFCIIGLQIGVTVWAFIEYDKVEETVANGLEGYTDQVKIDKSDSYQYVQETFKCCGTTSVCDGFSSDDEIYNGCECSSLDESICSDVLPDNSTCTKTPPNKIYTTPCSVAVYEFIDDNILLIGCIALAIILIEILGMVVACCFCNHVKDEKFSCIHIAKKIGCVYLCPCC